jgi:peptide/nickel transport system permease protein
MKRLKTRLFEYLFTLLVVLTLNFLLPRMMPGDPFLFLSSESGEEVARFTPAQEEMYRHQYGLDRPWPVQYAAYLGGLLRGDLGYSIYYNQDVTKILMARLPWTLFLVLSAVFLSTFAGCLLGGVSASCRNTALDRLLYPFMIALTEVPSFLLGLVLLFVFAAGMKLFPLSGAMTHFAGDASTADRIIDIARHAVLPIATLTLVRTGAMYLLARNSMTTVLAKDYIRTARAKGLGPLRILARHSLRNAMVPVITRVFLGLGGLVGGAILVENVFAYPGLGLLMRESVMVHDYPMIQGIFLLVTVIVLVANLLADFIYRRLDPRIAATFREQT